MGDNLLIFTGNNHKEKPCLRARLHENQHFIAILNRMYLGASLDFFKGFISIIL
jgi:hypothetical protein